MFKNKFLCSFLAVLIFLSTMLTAFAQSGRKAPVYPKYPTQTTSNPNDEKNSTVKTSSDTSAENNLKKIALLVADDEQRSMDLQFMYPENMKNWVINRLTKAQILDVSAIGGQMNRSQAIKRAKTETQTLVVLLELEENFINDTDPSKIRSQARSFWINYYIYAPETGKAAHKGRVDSRMPGVFKNGKIDRIGVTCYPGVRGADLQLLRASIEAADRIMSDLNVILPPLC